GGERRNSSQNGAGKRLRRRTMDMQMPVMDGLRATRAIRSNPHLEKLPIIAMTANAMASDREQCLTAGMNDHSGKPIDPDELFSVLLRWTGAGKAEAKVESGVDTRLR